jgi:outer membrane protein assembly factor BamB
MRLRHVSQIKEFIMHRAANFVGLLLVGIISTAHAADWPQFRGPGGNATSSETGLPTTWSAKQNVAWRTELPGLGTSSPVIVGNRVFVTCYSGYAASTDEPGDMSKLMRHVVCVDRNTGKIVWKKEIPPSLPESEYQGRNNTWHGYSSSTPVCDGKQLYVFFGKTGVFCFDLEGDEIWRTTVGDGLNKWGSGSSPVLFEDTLIVNASVESGAVVALDKKSGTEKWRARVRGCWNTPHLVQAKDGGFELVVSLPQKILAFDPKNGTQLWECEGIPDDGYICPSVISHEGIVYAIGGRRNTAIAVRAGGRGDVSKSHVVWRVNAGSNVSSPVYLDGYLYWIHEREGAVNCLNTKNGEVVYQKRLEPRPGTMYASATAADGKLYCPSQHAGVYVVAAKPEFELLAHNVFEDDENRMNASVAVHQGQILLRNDKYLYCIGEPRKTTALLGR